MDNYILTRCRILDGTENMKPTGAMSIVISNGKIEKICETQDEPNGYFRIDTMGAYAMPGLINLHVHLAGSGKPKKKQSDPVKAVKLVTANALTRKVGMSMVAGFAEQQLRSGVTTIRTVGGIRNFDSLTRDKIDAGKLVGPRILASNMAVSVPEGHMAGSLGYIAHNAAEAEAYVQAAVDSGADWVKLMITGGVLDAVKKGEPGVLKMPPEVVKAACDKAHSLGKRVCAHVESPEGVKVALQNGVDTIEHGAKPDKEILELFKSTGASLVTTLSPALPFALFDRSVSHATEMQQYNGKIVFDGIVECARACLDAGIPVGLGTDTACPYVTQYDMWRELNLMRKYCGVSNAFALHTATQVNAEILGIGDITGTLEAGKSADILLTRSNPLDNLEVLRKPWQIVFRGTEYAPRVKKYPQVEQELDKFL